jgi:hypothetical protein
MKPVHDPAMLENIALRARAAVEILVAIENAVEYDTPPGRGSEVPQRIANAVAIYVAEATRR